MHNGEKEPKEHIKDINVPSEDVPEWIKTLHEGGFSSEEIDAFMAYNNDEYARARYEQFLEQELDIFEEVFEKQFGRRLKGAERNLVNDVILDRFRKMNALKSEKQDRPEMA